MSSVRDILRRMEEEKKKEKEERRRRTERIRKAPEPALRKAVMTLCNRDPDIKNRILRCLDDLAAGPSRKRKAEDNIKCVRCKENFIDDDDNYETEPCCYHPGTLRLDRDAETWMDWSLASHNPIEENDFYREKYGDGFKWDCCLRQGRGLENGPGDEWDKGCEYGPHGGPRELRQPNVYRCAHCDEEFEKRHNHQESCTYHPGQLKINEDADLWWGWNEDDNGGGSDEDDEDDEDGDDNERDDERDTRKNREKHPEGFRWSCCEEQGDETDGCFTGPHVPKIRPAKRRRMQQELEIIDLTSD